MVILVRLSFQRIHRSLVGRSERKSSDHYEAILCATDTRFYCRLNTAKVSNETIQHASIALQIAVNLYRQYLCQCSYFRREPAPKVLEGEIITSKAGFAF